MPRLVLLILLSGCAGIVENVNARSQEDIAKRAAFDLDCRAESLNFEVLETFPTGEARSFGVRGCGRKATYVLAAGGAWILNSPVESTVAPAGS